MFKSIISSIMAAVVTFMMMFGLLWLATDALACEEVGGCVVILPDGDHAMFKSDPSFDTRRNRWVIEEDGVINTFPADTKIYGPEGRFVFAGGYVSQISDLKWDIVKRATGEVVDEMEDVELVNDGASAKWVCKFHNLNNVELTCSFDAAVYAAELKK